MSGEVQLSKFPVVHNRFPSNLLCCLYCREENNKNSKNNIKARTYVSACYVHRTFLSTVTILIHLISAHKLLYNLKESGDKNSLSEL